MPHISLAAEVIGHIGGLPITNALLTSWIVTAGLILFSLIASRRLTLIPAYGQSIVELVIGGLYDFFGSVTGKQKQQFFPLIASLFIFIIIANWVGLLPGVGTIGFTKVSESADRLSLTEAPHTEFVPLLRGATADLNMTLALAIVAVVAIQYFGFRTVGVRYSRRFLNFSNPINFSIGILELVSEFSKIISFTFRLFGNIFAGEVLLTVMAFLMPVLVPLPFLMLELFVGFIQALVFSMLTAVFLNVAVSHGEEHGGR